MKLNSVVTPVQNYLESEDLIFEIGDEETDPKKKPDDDRVGFGHDGDDIETEEPEEDPDADTLDEFDDFEWGDDEDEE